MLCFCFSTGLVPRSKSTTPRNLETRLKSPQFPPTGFKMAAAFQKLRFAWSFRAVFAGREFVINTLHQAKTKNKATTHIRKGVCLEWFFFWFFQGSNKLFIIHFDTMYHTSATDMLQIKIKFRLNFFNPG